MQERGQILVLTDGRPAERWRGYTTLYLYPAVMCQDHGTGALPRPRDHLAGCGVFSDLADHEVADRRRLPSGFPDRGGEQLCMGVVEAGKGRSALAGNHDDATVRRVPTRRTLDTLHFQVTEPASRIAAQPSHQPINPGQRSRRPNPPPNASPGLPGRTATTARSSRLGSLPSRPPATGHYVLPPRSAFVFGGCIR